MRSIYGILLVGSIGLAVMVCQCPRAAEGLLRLVRLQLSSSGNRAEAAQAPSNAPLYRPRTTAPPPVVSQRDPRPTGNDVGVAFAQSGPVAGSSNVGRGAAVPPVETSAGGYRYPSTNSRPPTGPSAAPIVPRTPQQVAPRDPPFSPNHPFGELSQHSSGQIVSQPPGPGQGFSTQPNIPARPGFPPPREAVPSPRIANTTGPASYRPEPADTIPDFSAPLYTSRRTTDAFSGSPTTPGQPPASRQTQPPALRGPVPYEGAQQLARVGDIVILACEILPAFNETLAGQEEAMARMPPEQLEQQKQMLMQALLTRRIETMLVYADFQRSVPPEGVADFEKRISEQFETDELPQKLKQSGLASRQELEAELRKLGSSLERQKSNYIRQFVRQWWPRQQLGEDIEVTHDQMLAYYREHTADYAHPARSRWEQLTVLFENHPSKQEAWQKVTWLGNQVAGGAPFDVIAREHSEGSAAAKGGVWGWTGRDVLRSEVINQAIFSQPVGRFGARLEDESGFHIVRVVERDDASHTPFEESQVAIRETLQQEHKEAKLAEYSKRLQEEIEVWTIFDEDTTASRPAAATPRPY